MNNLANKTTFWSFLKHTQIQIPIIQRDYAQGRRGKENLRENFLGSIGEALDAGPQLKLDFVYGSGDGVGHFSPLDGQQRLTTLWLLHWYLAFKTEELQKDVIRNVLQRFSYDTRESSKAFILMLVNKGNDIKQKADENIADAIIRQSWMFTSWRQDPTVQSMLRMLSGEINDKVDGIEELLKDKTKEQLVSYWAALTGNTDSCPIVFYQLDIDNMGQNDDLYVKMNGRGKPLTDFENFKADLIKYFEDQGWSDFMDPEAGYPILMDTTWTDFFWDYRQKEIPFDDLFFTFINRFFLSELIIRVPDLEKSEVETKRRIVYDYLYSFIEKKSKRSQFTEIGFGVYRDFFNLLSIESENKGEDGNDFIKDVFVRLKRLLNNIASFKKTMGVVTVNSPYYQDKTFEPVYVKITKTGVIQDYYSLTQPQMVIFWAMCYFFEQDSGVFDDQKETDKSLRKWMRLVWNISDFNDEIRNKQALISTIQNLKMIVNDPTNSYQSILSSVKEYGASDDTAFDAHVREERAKIEKMKHQYDGIIPAFAGKSWNDVILDVEKKTFLSGTIRCLFLNASDKFDWSDFDEKYRHFQYYSEKQMGHIAVRNYLLIDYNRLAADYWYEAGSIKNTSHWRTLLSQKKYAKAVHDWLISNPLGETDLSSLYPRNANYEYRMVIGSRLLELVEDDRGLYLANSSSCNMKVLMHHQASTPYILMYKARNETIQALLDEGLISLLKQDDWIPDVHMWKTKDLDFTYNGKSYTWTGNGRIQLKGSDPLIEKKIGNTVSDVDGFIQFMVQFP